MQREHACDIFSLLYREYVTDDSRLCFLDFENPFEILVLTILSAQTTDATVNRIRDRLFLRYPDARALAAAEAGEVEEIIRPTGFYHTKARNIIAASRCIVERFGGRVPATMADLISLPGVGRKTANIVLHHAYGIHEGIAVDTHVKRLSRRLGFTGETDPDRIEQALLSLFPPLAWKYLNYLLISHGRRICTARHPKCGECIVSDLCPSTRRDDREGKPSNQ